MSVGVFFWGLGSRYVEAGVGAVDSSADDFALVHEDTPDGGFVGGERELGHVDGFAHEGFVVFAVGDGAEDGHFGGRMFGFGWSCFGWWKRERGYESRGFWWMGLLGWS